MTPEKYAGNLIIKFFDLLGDSLDTSDRFQRAKKCALISVSESIRNIEESCDSLSAILKGNVDFFFSEKIKFLNAVKQEIIFFFLESITQELAYPPPSIPKD